MRTETQFGIIYLFKMSEFLVCENFWSRGGFTMEMGNILFEKPKNSFKVSSQMKLLLNYHYFCIIMFTSIVFLFLLLKKYIKNIFFMLIFVLNHFCGLSWMPFEGTGEKTLNVILHKNCNTCIFRFRFRM